MSREDERLQRQFRALERSVPAGQGLLRLVRRPRYRLLRVPLALLLVAGGFIGFLPVLGFWMLPLGLLLLAVDIPALQPWVSSAMIRLRRRIGVWRQRRRAPRSR